MVKEYNKVKGYVDLSDQMVSYTPFIRKTTKWYLRLFFHLIMQTTMINAWKLYCDVNRKIGITEFKCQIIESLLSKKRLSSSLSNHKLFEVAGINLMLNEFFDSLKY